jgi:hypothetical protein
MAPPAHRPVHGGHRALSARNPRAEASARAGGRYDARVLEPSPPAVAEPPWFADDPIGRDVPRGELPLLLPFSSDAVAANPTGSSETPRRDVSWDQLCADDRELASWCAERWLGAWRTLPSVPPGLVQTRETLHALAEQVISPARDRANGKIGLRYTCRGFGTPFFGDERQLRVEGDRLIEQHGPRSHSRALEVDAAAADFLGDWYGFATSVLEQLRADVGEDAEPSRVQLWPEHFDVSVELGAEQAGKRAGYGASPGDEQHPEPYLYVTPWAELPDGELWQATAFRGAELPYAALLQAPSGAEQRELALGFFGARLAALA